MEMTLHTPVIANAMQREKWNNETGSRWLERHAIVDQQIAPFGRPAERNMQGPILVPR